jgi:MarR family transcriptional regulator, transcriptional regulator for hemolysin
MSSTLNSPLGKTFSTLTKLYVGALTARLNDLDIERHFYVLYLVKQRNSPVSQKCLGELLGYDKTNMVRVVDYLSNHGYVERVQNPNDRREHFVELTPKALDLLPRIESAFKEVNDFAVNGFTPQELEKFASLLAQIEVNLMKLPSRPVHIDFKPKK